MPSRATRICTAFIVVAAAAAVLVQACAGAQAAPGLEWSPAVTGDGQTDI